MFALISLIMLIGSVQAYEQTLTNFDFNGVENTANNSAECKELLINMPAKALEEKGEGILSINANFNEVVNDSTYVSVTINEKTEKKYWNESFDCTEKCWARIFVPELREGKTKIKICAVLGGKTKGLEITEESMIGIYDTPVLTIKNSAPASIHLGSRAKMVITVTNFGTKASAIFVQFIHPDVRALVPITSLDIVEGDSSATTVIAAGETRQFIYYIKPTVISGYNLPSAALFFKNIFGEEETILSEHPFMLVTKQKQIEVSIVMETENDSRLFKAIVKNNYSLPFSGKITMAPQTIFENYAQEINIAPNSEKEIIFQSKDLQKGNYSFFATIMDSNQIYSSNTINVEVTKSEFPIQILLAISAIIIGAIIFGWIYFAKEK